MLIPANFVEKAKGVKVIVPIRVTIAELDKRMARHLKRDKAA